MSKLSTWRALGPVALLCGGFVAAWPSNALAAAAAGGAEPVDVTVCRLIESAAHAQGLPSGFLTRLIWQESSFRPTVVSPAGAQGIAQFMPRTGAERGLADPFDPEEAIPKAAGLLADLTKRFGNFGLAAAAYNAGPTRVANWLAGHGSLPAETQDYVLNITGHPAADWTAGAEVKPDKTDSSATQPCLQVAAAIRVANPRHYAGSALLGAWGVQLAGSFSKAAALAAYGRAQRSYSALLGNVEPMILGGRLMNRGFKPFYRVRAPAPTREAANVLCGKIVRLGGACAVLRN